MKVTFSRDENMAVADGKRYVFNSDARGGCRKCAWDSGICVRVHTELAVPCRCGSGDGRRGYWKEAT